MTETLKTTWANQVLEEHRELRAKKNDLADYLRRKRPEVGETGAHTWAAELARRLVDLHDELYRHFRFEEEGGMVEEIVSRHPRASANVERLMKQHPEMLTETRTLMSEALTYSEGREPEDSSLRFRVANLLRRLDQHEAEEDGMIHDLELLDLGLGD